MSLSIICMHSARTLAKNFIAPARALITSTPVRTLSYNGNTGGDYGEEAPHGGYDRGNPERKSRPFGSSRGNQDRRPGDWDCTECGNHVFGSRDFCPRCHTPKFNMAGKSANLASSGGKGGGRDNEHMDHGHDSRDTYVKRNEPQFLSGDWSCPNCEFHNFASRQVCLRCQTPSGIDNNYKKNDGGGGGDVGGGFN